MREAQVRLDEGIQGLDRDRRVPCCQRSLHNPQMDGADDALMRLGHLEERAMVQPYLPFSVGRPQLWGEAQVVQQADQSVKRLNARVRRRLGKLSSPGAARLCGALSCLRSRLQHVGEDARQQRELAGTCRIHAAYGVERCCRATRADSGPFDALDAALAQKRVEMEPDRVRMHVQPLGDLGDVHGLRRVLQYRQDRSAPSMRLSGRIRHVVEFTQLTVVVTQMEDFTMADRELDVRTLRKPDKHPTIFSTYRELTVGESFFLINDHDPKHLHDEFEVESPGSYGWEYVESGPRLFRIQITKLASTPLPRILLDTTTLGSGSDAEPGGAVWKLGISERDLDTNVINLAAGDQIDAHAGPEADVLLHILNGSGQLVTELGVVELTPGAVVWLPRRSRRQFVAGADGLRYLSVHQRRQALVLQTTRPDGA